MDKKIEKVLEIWHERFSIEDNQYSEFEDSDIEYFVGCMLYNHFAFINALDNVKTMDLSYDFLCGCGEKEYAEVKSLIDSIDISDEKEKLEFLLGYINEVKPKYSNDELYLINRLEYHVSGVAQRYETGEEAKKVTFEAPVARSRNPLLR